MARKYEHIQKHEKEIKEMLEEGLSRREIGEALGLLSVVRRRKYCRCSDVLHRYPMY